MFEIFKFKSKTTEEIPTDTTDQLEVGSCWRLGFRLGWFIV
jgi:hypothetical protein